MSNLLEDLVAHGASDVVVFRGRPLNRITISMGDAHAEVWVVSAVFELGGAKLNLSGQGDTIPEAIAAIRQMEALARESIG